MQKSRKTELKNPAVFTMQVSKTIFDHFSTLPRKGQNYTCQEFFKGIISIILCKTVTLRNAETFYSKQNLFNVFLETVIGKNSYQLTAFYTAPKAIFNTIGNFKIFEKFEINYLCK